MTHLTIVIWMLVATGCGASATVAQGGAGKLQAGADAGGATDGQGTAGTPLAIDRTAVKRRPTAWLGGSAISTTMLHAGSGETHIGLWVDVPDDAANGDRRPAMALSLVIDASGSMAGEKIRHARAAAARMVEALDDGDLVSLVTFDDVVTEVVALTSIDDDSRRFILRAISQIRHGGSTNLYGAIEAGQRAVGHAPPSHPVRRVLVISDGIANVGPSSPADFAALAERGAHNDIQISAIGVGLRYDEHTLGALATHSEGRMHHLEHPQQMIAILEQELQLLAKTVGTSAFVEITPAAGVVLGQLATGRVQRVGRLMIIPLGTLIAGQQREMLITASVPTGDDGRRKLASVRLVYEPYGLDETRVQQLALGYAVSQDVHAVEASYDGRVEAMVASHGASEKQRIAAEMLNRGQQQQAAEMLQRAESQLAIAIERAPAARKKSLRKARRRTEKRKQQARKANSPRAQREAALSTYGMSMDLKGY